MVWCCFIKVWYYLYKAYLYNIVPVPKNTKIQKYTQFVQHSASQKQREKNHSEVLLHRIHALLHTSPYFSKLLQTSPYFPYFSELLRTSPYFPYFILLHTSP